MKNKIKVGDLVRCIPDKHKENPGAGYSHAIHVGTFKVDIISEEYTSRPIVWSNTFSNGIYADCVEVVENIVYDIY